MAGTLQPLAAGDIAALLNPPTHGERIIALWALDCAYCEPNLEALAKLQRAHPRDIELVIVTTDSIERRRAIEARLQHMNVDGLPNRAYAEAMPERLNFLLDPTWGGETPRVLVIRADGSRLGISGELTPAQMRKIR
jgi:iron complex outermembrane receptor protein